MAKPPKRNRAVRRAADRDAKKTQENLVRLEALAPGGAPDRPIELVSASQVETDAESRPCALCGGGVRAVDHRAIDHQGMRLRVVDAVCRLCHRAWLRHYRIGPVLS